MNSIEAGSLLAGLAFGDSQVDVHVVPPKAARFAPIESDLHPILADRLTELGIAQTYTHQSIAIDTVLGGKDVMVITGTSSGKSLCYQVPAIQTCLTEPSAKALLLFPTKALAQDQFRKLDGLIEGMSLRAGVYDGDTPLRARTPIRTMAHFICSNPDMLHVGILPNHQNWVRFFKSLRLVVLDEAHAYRGVFGSHVAWVIRRLLRLCAHYGSNPTLVGTSATIGNPRQHFESLTGRVPMVVDEDGAPEGRQTFLFVNPNLGDDGKPVSRNLLAAACMTELAKRGASTMAFCRSRVSVELVLKYSRELASHDESLEESMFEGYRAGYTPKERRAIEAGLSSGSIRGLATTNAMELGVDIGGLDAVYMNGYPGTVSSFWQQAGRAGRSGSEGHVILVAQEDPMEQFIVNSPQALLNKNAERLSTRPENTLIAGAHLRCMAHERPIASHELMAIGLGSLELAEEMDGTGDFEFRGGYFYYPSREAPAPNVGLRGVGSEGVVLVKDGEELGAMERWRAMQSAHKGAIYLHRGNVFEVRELDLDSGRAELASSEANYYTQTVVQSAIEPLMVLKQIELDEGLVTLTALRITTEIPHYKLKSLDGESVLGIVPLELPPTTFETIGIRLDLPDADPDADPEVQLAAVHGCEHALLAIAPFLAGCERSDLGGAWYAMMFDTLKPAVFIYDGCPGGIGLSEALFEAVRPLLWGSKSLIESCSCDAGCPRCIFTSRCESNNDLLSKRGAMDLLRRMCQGQSA